MLINRLEVRIASKRLAAILSIDNTFPLIHAKRTHLAIAKENNKKKMNGK